MSDSRSITRIDYLRLLSSFNLLSEKVEKLLNNPSLLNPEFEYLNEVLLSLDDRLYRTELLTTYNINVSAELAVGLTRLQDTLWYSLPGLRSVYAAILDVESGSTVDNTTDSVQQFINGIADQMLATTSFQTVLQNQTSFNTAVAAAVAKLQQNSFVTAHLRMSIPSISTDSLVSKTDLYRVVDLTNAVIVEPYSPEDRKYTPANYTSDKYSYNCVALAGLTPTAATNYFSGKDYRGIDCPAYNDTRSKIIGLGVQNWSYNYAPGDSDSVPIIASASTDGVVWSDYLGLKVKFHSQLCSWNGSSLVVTILYATNASFGYASAVIAGKNQYSSSSNDAPPIIYLEANYSSNRYNSSNNVRTDYLNKTERRYVSQLPTLVKATVDAVEVVGFQFTVTILCDSNMPYWPQVTDGYKYTPYSTDGTNVWYRCTLGTITLLSLNTWWVDMSKTSLPLDNGRSPGPYVTRPAFTTFNAQRGNLLFDVLLPPSGVSPISGVSLSQFVLQTYTIQEIDVKVQNISADLIIIKQQITSLSNTVSQITDLLQAQAKAQEAAKSSPLAIVGEVFGVLGIAGQIFSLSAKFAKIGMGLASLAALGQVATQIGSNAITGNWDVGTLVMQVGNGFTQLMVMKTMLKNPVAKLATDDLASNRLLNDIEEVQKRIKSSTTVKSGTTATIKARPILADDFSFTGIATVDDFAKGVFKFYGENFDHPTFKQATDYLLSKSKAPVHTNVEITTNQPTTSKTYNYIDADSINSYVSTSVSGGLIKSNATLVSVDPLVQTRLKSVLGYEGLIDPSLATYLRGQGIEVIPKPVTNDYLELYTGTSATGKEKWSLVIPSNIPANQVDEYVRVYQTTVSDAGFRVIKTGASVASHDDFRTFANAALQSPDYLGLSNNCNTMATIGFDYATSFNKPTGVSDRVWANYLMTKFNDNLSTAIKASTALAGSTRPLTADDFLPVYRPDSANGMLLLPAQLSMTKLDAFGTGRTQILSELNAKRWDAERRLTNSTISSVNQPLTYAGTDDDVISLLNNRAD